MDSIALAVISGTIVASLTYLIKQGLDFWLFNPWNEYQSLRGKILEAAIFFSHFLERLPSSRQDETKSEIVKIWVTENQNLRRLAGSLIAFQKKNHYLLFGVPSRSALRSGASDLLSLASCTRDSDLDKAKKHAAALIKTLDASSLASEVSE